METRYKFLRTGYKSENGNHKWNFGKWYETEGGLKMCGNGFHCSKGIYQSFSYEQGEILVQVEVDGKHLSEDDKDVWEKMRIIKSWKWTKKDSRYFSIYAAKLALRNFENIFPNDGRPRKAIEAAERYLKNPTAKKRDSVRAAERCAGWSAALLATLSTSKSTNWSIAWYATIAATRAANTILADDAGRMAAETAWYATRAAIVSERANIYKKLDKWMENHLVNLKVLREITN